MFPTILIVDDEPSIIYSLEGLLSDEGFEVLTASNGYEALKIVESEFPDLILLDIWMPGLDGIETLKEIKKENPFISIIMVTGHGTIEAAVNAIKLGAFDFIEKPISIDRVIIAINNALNFRKLQEENKYLKTKTLSKHSITGATKCIAELKKQIIDAAPSDASILITGEHGTGKELIARNIHHLSNRSEQVMITVNCATIPDDMVESELFGHEKGAFNGAISKNIGKFELASNGTLFLDEIGDMSLKNQAKILRVLQEHKFKRLGGTRTLNANIRVIAATNKNLEKEIKNNNFREDLYYRLNIIPIHVPPLRQRKQDIPALVQTFFAENAKQHNIAPKSMDDEAIELLLNYSWPGNIRELKNLVERLCIMVKKDTIKASDIPAPYNTQTKQEKTAKKLFQINSLKEASKAFEKKFLSKKLAQYQGDIDKAAKAVDIDKDKLIKILEI